MVIGIAALAAVLSFWASLLLEKFVIQPKARTELEQTRPDLVADEERYRVALEDHKRAERETIAAREAARITPAVREGWARGQRGQER